VTVKYTDFPTSLKFFSRVNTLFQTLTAAKSELFSADDSPLGLDVEITLLPFQILILPAALFQSCGMDQDTLQNDYNVIQNDSLRYACLVIHKK